MIAHDAFIDRFLVSPPQTNDIRRAAAIIADAHVLRDLYDLPFRITELRTSGGLNLMFDHFALALPKATLGPANPALTLRPDWTGDDVPVAAPQILDRAGVDLNPLDSRDAAGALRLQA